jgi:hypothetical protein
MAAALTLSPKNSALESIRACSAERHWWPSQENTHGYQLLSAAYGPRRWLQKYSTTGGGDAAAAEPGHVPRA